MRPSLPQENSEQEVEQYLKRTFEDTISRIVRRHKIDLDMPNHLVAGPRQFLQLCFRNVNDLYKVRKVLQPLVRRNQERRSTLDAYADAGCAVRTSVKIALGRMADLHPVSFRECWPAHLGSGEADGGKGTRYQDVRENFLDIREYDVPYYLRVAIDMDLRVGHWYTVKATHGHISMARQYKMIERADTVVLGTCRPASLLPAAPSADG